MGNSGPTADRAVRASKATPLAILATTAAMLLGLPAELHRPAAASPPSAEQSSWLTGSASHAARRDAIRSIPLERLAPEARTKVDSVLSNVSVFRRLPVSVVDCDPDLYLFLVRHPDIVVSIWEMMKLSRLQLQQLDENQFRATEPAGTTADFEFVYRGHDVHILYGEGTYEGPLLARPVKGRGVLVLKCGYVRETNGRYYITSRLDCFLTIEPLAAELIGKTVSPLLGKTVDNNFVQTVAFLSSLSRTAEVNNRGVQHLAARLSRVAPDVRLEFSDVAAGVARKSATAATEDLRKAAEVAGRPDDNVRR